MFQFLSSASFCASRWNAWAVERRRPITEGCTKRISKQTPNIRYRLMHILFLERILPMHIEKKAKSIAIESSNWDLQVLPCFTDHLALFISDCCSSYWSSCLVSVTEPMLRFVVNTPTKKNHLSLSLSLSFSFGEHDRTVVFCNEHLCISWESLVRCLYHRNVNHS